MEKNIKIKWVDISSTKKGDKIRIKDGHIGNEFAEVIGKGETDDKRNYVVVKTTSNKIYSYTPNTKVIVIGNKNRLFRKGGVISEGTIIGDYNLSDVYYDLEYSGVHSNGKIYVADNIISRDYVIDDLKSIGVNAYKYQSDMPLHIFVRDNQLITYNSKGKKFYKGGELKLYNKGKEVEWKVPVVYDIYRVYTWAVSNRIDLDKLPEKIQEDIEFVVQGVEQSKEYLLERIKECQEWIDDAKNESIEKNMETSGIPLEIMKNEDIKRIEKNLTNKEIKENIYDVDLEIIDDLISQYGITFKQLVNDNAEDIVNGVNNEDYVFRLFYNATSLNDLADSLDSNEQYLDEFADYVRVLPRDYYNNILTEERELDKSQLSMFDDVTEEEPIKEDSNDIRELLPEKHLIKLLKSIKFKSFDSNDIKEVEYNTETYNPFDKSFTANINAYPCIITIRKDSNVYEVRIGKDSGWIGGIAFGNWEYIFNIGKITFGEFEKGLMSAIENNDIVLYSKYGTGNFDKLYFIGTEAEADKFTSERGYKKVEDGGIFGFHYYNPTMESWKNESTLTVGRFTKSQIERLEKGDIPIKETKKEEPKKEQTLAEKMIANLENAYNKDQRAFMNMIYSLAGDSKRRFRQEIMGILEGKKVPVSKSGIHAIEEAIKNRVDSVKEDIVIEDNDNPFELTDEERKIIEDEIEVLEAGLEFFDPKTEAKELGEWQSMIDGLKMSLREEIFADGGGVSVKDANIISHFDNKDNPKVIEFYNNSINIPNFVGYATIGIGKDSHTIYIENIIMEKPYNSEVNKQKAFKSIENNLKNTLFKNVSKIH